MKKIFDACNPKRLLEGVHPTQTAAPKKSAAADFFVQYND